MFIDLTEGGECPAAPPHRLASSRSGRSFNNKTIIQIELFAGTLFPDLTEGGECPAAHPLGYLLPKSRSE